MLVFLGDSIFQWWDRLHFDNFFSVYEPLNFGVAGYTTKDVLKFLNLSTLYTLKPKIIVILIGTNNSDHNYTTGETVEDIKQIISLIKEISADSKIVLLGILPRGESLTDRKRVFNDMVNKSLKEQEFDKNVHYIDIGFIFLKGKETVSKDLMYDGLHLTSEGYKLLSDTLSSLLPVILAP
jgi:lysophospholipase L1-like esterase